MVHPWKPERFETFHPLHTDQGILQGVIEGVTHVKGSGHIRWWDDDGEWEFGRVRIRDEVPGIEPLLIERTFEFFRIEGGCQLAHDGAHHS